MEDKNFIINMLNDIKMLEDIEIIERSITEKEYIFICMNEAVETISLYIKTKRRKTSKEKYFKLCFNIAGLLWNIENISPECFNSIDIKEHSIKRYRGKIKFSKEVYTKMLKDMETEKNI